MLSAYPTAKFIAGWTPLAAIATVADPELRLADLFIFTLGGYQFPPVTMVLGALGVLMARPLARKRESELPLAMFLLVGAIMVIVIELWVLENRPGALFAWVVAGGVGFSGYTLIENFGLQVQGWFTGKFAPRADTSTPLANEADTKPDEEIL